MRFKFYDESLAAIPKLAVDGTVGNAKHFSHWQGNTTDPSIIADTSTEIALNAVQSPDWLALTGGIDLVTNNHFDTDGLLSVWTMLHRESAAEFRNKLIPTAESGDFSEFPNKNAVRSSILIQGSEYTAAGEGVSSPLCRKLSKGSPASESAAYDLLLPMVPDILNSIDNYEDLWRDDWDRIEIALQSFESSASRIHEHADSGLSEIFLEPELFKRQGFKPTKHVAPYTAIAHNARGRLFLISAPMSGGWSYRIDYPYYSWAVTVVRPKVERRDFSEFIQQLNQIEGESSTGVKGYWNKDNSGLASAIKFCDIEGLPAVSSIEPEMLAGLLNDELKKTID